MGAGGQGDQLGHVDLDQAVVDGVGVRLHGLELLSALLRVQERLRHLVADKHAGGSARLNAHVGNGHTLGHGKVLHAVAVVLQNTAQTALDRDPAQQFQRHVLRAHAGAQLTGQAHADNLGHAEAETLAQRGLGHRQAASADRQRADRTGGRRMAVAADDDLAGGGKALAVDGVADTVAGLGEIKTETLGAGFQKIVVIRVLRGGAQHVVVAVEHGLFDLDPISLHGIEDLADDHGAQVVREGLIDLDHDLAAQLHNALRQVGMDDFFNKIHTGVVLLPEWLRPPGRSRPFIIGQPLQLLSEMAA